MNLSLEPLSITKRHVFYLSGFDPRGASFYHRLYQEESQKQARLMGANISVGARSHNDAHFNYWTVDAKWGNLQPNQGLVHVDYFFLNWDDIVRQHWQRSLTKLVLKSIPSYLGYIKSGAFKAISQDYKGPFFSALYPFFYLIVLLMLSIALGLIANLITAAILQPVFGLLVGFSVLLTMFAAGIKLANKWGVFWLLRTYLFVYELGLHDSSFILDRLSHFIEIIKDKQKSDSADEILIIGHSVGSILAVHLVAMLHEQYPALAAKVKLVTLGQCVPLQSGMSQAKLLNQHLSLLQSSTAIHWSDFVARADSLAFLKNNTSSVVKANLPIVKIVRFFNSFHSKTYAMIKRNKLRLHFQYLMASETVGDYDYFTLTAGSLPLNMNDKGSIRAL